MVSSMLAQPHFLPSTPQCFYPQHPITAAPQLRSPPRAPTSYSTGTQVCQCVCPNTAAIRKLLTKALPLRPRSQLTYGAFRFPTHSRTHLFDANKYLFSATHYITGLSKEPPTSGLKPERTWSPRPKEKMMMAREVAQ